jgi:Cd2+/Zn2+-exporting ATPase
LAKNGDYAGYLRIDDKLKEDAPTAIKMLRKLGIRNLVMLTGDQKEKAEQIAKKLGFDEFHGELKPEDKVAALENIIDKIDGKSKVAFVGDGINDAPVIARADVGIAMGALGSQAAIESADVVIMSDVTEKIPEAIQIGRHTRTIVWQNILLALGVKTLFIVLGITGQASMWEAVFADMGVAILAILNAARIIR